MNNGTKITAPISLHGDVYPVLAIAPSGAYYDVAEACKSGKINKWSFKKPIRYAQFPELTDAQIMSVNCGLTPNDLGLLRRNCNGLNGVTGGDDSKADILAEVSEWNYMQPNEYYRLTDFDGYNHGALPSDRDWNNYTFTRSELQEVADSDAKIASNTGVNATIDKSLKMMTQFSIRLADGDGNWIGNGNLDMLPLSYAAKGGVVSGEGWRIAYAVEIGSEWFLIVGRKPLDASLNVTDAKNYFPPDMSTNTRAVYRMLNSGQSSFTLIPCLVCNAIISTETHPTKGSQGYLMSYVQVNASTLIYAMPSGASSIKLTITSSGGTIPTINGIAVAASANNMGENSWVLGTINRGYGGAQNNIPIQQPVILTKYPAPTTSGSTSFNVRFTYKKYGNENAIQYPTSGVKTFTITNTDRLAVTYGGVTTQYWGMVLNDSALGGLGFTIEDVQTFTVQ